MQQCQDEALLPLPVSNRGHQIMFYTSASVCDTIMCRRGFLSGTLKAFSNISLKLFCNPLKASIAVSLSTFHNSSKCSCSTTTTLLHRLKREAKHAAVGRAAGSQRQRPSACFSLVCASLSLLPPHPVSDTALSCCLFLSDCFKSK